MTPDHRTTGSPDHSSSAGLESYRLGLERALEQHFPAADRTRLGRAMRYALFPGGKRIRPLLCLASYEACRGRSAQEVLPFACGIELIHTFSLIQDDLPAMDDDRVRRGKPCLHIAFDQALALLAADGLFARAFELFTLSAAPRPRLVRAIREIAQATGVSGIVGGQALDLSRDKSRDPKTLRQTHCRKTARLIAASMMSGAILAGAAKGTVQGIFQAGIMLGMLFQITDDLLDEGPPTGIEPQGTERPHRAHRREVASGQVVEWPGCRVNGFPPDPWATGSRGHSSSVSPAVASVAESGRGEGGKRIAAGDLTYVQLYGRAGAGFRARKYSRLYERRLESLGARLSPGPLRDLRALGAQVLGRTE